MGKYSDAKERFFKCQEQHFDLFYQFVLMEMKLCCSIKLRNLTVMLDDVEKFIEILESNDTPENIFAYVLISILQKDSLNLKEFYKNKANILLSRLQNMGVE
jgi:hypothetical protein